MKLRFATPGDSAAILEIYAQYINTPVTFEYVLPEASEFSGRIAAIGAFYPYIVCEGHGGIAGYAYAHRHMEREAYQWNAELSVYLHQDCTSQGLGKRMYQALIEILKLQGVRTVYGGVTLPNEKSEALHRSLGFQALGTYHNAGYKNGKWHDVTWFEKRIAPYTIDPEPVASIAALPGDLLQTILS